MSTFVQSPNSMLPKTAPGSNHIVNMAWEENLPYSLEHLKHYKNATSCSCNHSFSIFITKKLKRKATRCLLEICIMLKKPVGNLLTGSKNVTVETQTEVQFESETNTNKCTMSCPYA